MDSPIVRIPARPTRDEAINRAATIWAAAMKRIAAERAQGARFESKTAA